jgi:hypothetical protein
VVSATVLLWAAAVPIGWWVSDRVESNDRTCVACHLEPDVPLHARKFDEFTRPAPPVSLAAAHRAAQDGFRCADCHSGTGLLGRARVKLVSLADALRWLSGRFREPERMRHPLADADCAKCHAILTPARDDAFHAIDSHAAAFPRACVECHLAHPATRAADLDFLSREAVLPICRDCHEEL